MKKIDAVFILLPLITFTSCRTLRVIEQVPVEVHDTAYVAKVMHDSTYIDRWHTVEVKGDTVFVTDQQITVKWRTHTDTAYKYVEKPVKVTVEQIKEVEKPLTKWQKFKMRGFWWLAVGLAGYILWRTRRLWGKLIKL